MQSALIKKKKFRIALYSTCPGYEGKTFIRGTSPKGIVRFWSGYKPVTNVFPHKAEPPARSEPDNAFWIDSTDKSPISETNKYTP